MNEENVVNNLYLLSKQDQNLSDTQQQAVGRFQMKIEVLSYIIHHFFQIFHVELEYVIFEMIHWANLKGRQFQGNMGQALPPVSAVTNGSNPLSLLPKQAGGLGPCCPKTVCPSNSPSESFQKLHISILHEKLRESMYIKSLFFNFHLKMSCILVCDLQYIIAQSFFLEF